jgi:hypothetical protein
MLGAIALRGEGNGGDPRLKAIDYLYTCHMQAKKNTIRHIVHKTC